MVAMATSLRCKVLAISAFSRPTIQTPSITNCLVAIVLTKPVIVILGPKLVVTATSLSTSGSHLTHDTYGPSEPQSKRHLDRLTVFAQMTTECPYTLQWDASFPPPKKNCPFP